MHNCKKYINIFYYLEIWDSPHNLWISSAITTCSLSSADWSMQPSSSFWVNLIACNNLLHPTSLIIYWRYSNPCCPLHLRSPRSKILGASTSAPIGPILSSAQGSPSILISKTRSIVIRPFAFKHLPIAQYLKYF